MQKCSKRTVRQMEELAIFVNFVIFERYNNYFRPEPRLLYAACSFKPVYDYFLAKFDKDSGELKTAVMAFKAARYFAPNQLNELKPDPLSNESLKLFPFFDDEAIDKLKIELPTYLAAAEDVSLHIQLTDWWNNHH